MTRHGIIIIHGVGQHEKLDVLTGFAKGVVETIEQRVGRPGVALQSLKEVSFQADLDAEHEDNYVEISWGTGQEEQAFEIREAYWQRSFQPPSERRVLRWLWRVVTVLLGLHTASRQSFALAFGAVTNVGLLLAVPVGLGFVLRLLQGLFSWLEHRFSWLDRLFSLAASLLERLPDSVKQTGQTLVNVTFAESPIVSQRLIGLFVVFSATAAVWLLMTVLRMWRIRGLGRLKTALAPLAGVRIAGIAISMEVLMLLGRFVRVFPLPRSWKDALVGFLGGFSAWVQQDAFGDFEVFASDSLMAATMRRQLERQIEHFQDKNEGFDEIHIVGHSLGGIISFEVLSRTLQNKDRIRTFFSVGSPIKKFLSLMIEMQPGGRVAELVHTRLEGFAKDRGLTSRVEPLTGRLEKWAYHPQRDRFFERKIDGFHEDFRWRNIIANWDFFPDELEKGFWYSPNVRPWGEVVDVQVNSTRRRGAHSAYWDRDCDTMRYILEEIAPDFFGDELHEKNKHRKEEFSVKEEVEKGGLTGLRDRVAAGL